MTYYTADLIHDGRRYLPAGSSVRMADNGIIDEILLAQCPDDAKHYAGTLCPGLVNAHCHLELSHLGGTLPLHLGMVAFAMGIMQRRASHGLEERRQAATAAAAAMHAEGVVAIGDICNTDDLAAMPHLGGLQRHSFVEALGVLPQTAAASMQRTAALLAQIETAGGRGSITPHAPYSVSPLLFQEIDAFRPHSLLSVHNQESAAENEYAMSKTGAFSKLYRFLKIEESELPLHGSSSLVAWLQNIVSPHPLLLVHNTFSSKADLALLLKRSAPTYLCTCPGSNLFIEEALPDYNMWLESGLPICIGTDSIASNTQLSMVYEMNLIKHLVAEETLISWATANGADALGMPHLGRLEPGRAPGLVQLSTLWERSRLLVKAGGADPS